MKSAYHNAQGLIKDFFKYLSLKECQDSIYKKFCLQNILDRTGLGQEDQGSCFILPLSFYVHVFKFPSTF